MTPDPLPLLLADRSPALRLRALREVCGVEADDPEAAELAARVPHSDDVLRALDSPGDTRSLAFALCRLAFLGLDRADERVADIGERLFALQRPDGSWPVDALRDPSLRSADPRPRMTPLQTSIPLRGLAAAGWATDDRAERAYEWLAAHRLEDGSWPTGVVAGQRAYVAGYRRLPRSEGCRANTTGAVACLALHPRRRTSDDARAGLDVLLRRETRDEWTLGFEVARLAGVEPVRGFITFYARFDLAFLLDLAGRCGASMADPRVADLVAFVESLRGPYGLWDHPAHPQLSRWLTLEVLAALRRLESGDWVGDDLRVPFRAYPKRRPRY